MNKSTSTTSKEMYGVQDWQKATSGFKELELEREPSLKEFYGNFWPPMESYVSPLNPIFLLDLPKAIEHVNKESWLVRDGLIPLIWFFTKNPAPEGFRAKLRIHADFEEYVPEAWRPQVELYRQLAGNDAGYESRRSPRKVTTLYLLGLVSPSVCSISELERNLKDIVTFIGGPKKIAALKIKAFLPARFEPNDIFSEPSFSSRFIATICRHLSANIEFFEFESFRSMYPEEGSWVHEFNSGDLYSDSYLSSVAISKGIKVLPIGRFKPENERTSFDQIVPLYPHVSCGIRTHFRKPFINYLNESWIAESKERAQVFNRTVSAVVNRVYPWPEWFQSWCKELPRQEIN